MDKIFDNTQNAFALKSDTELDRAYFLFKMISIQPLVRILCKYNIVAYFFM